MEKHFLILATTSDFLWKFEMENVKILQQMGYVVHYAANMNEPHYLPGPEKIQALGVQAHHIDIARSPFMVQYNYAALHQLAAIIKSYQIRILHCHTPVGGLLGRLAGRLCKGLVVIYTAHGFHFYRGAPLLNRVAYYSVEKALAKSTDFLIVINREDYEIAKKFRLKKNGRVEQIPGVGLDLEKFHPLPEERRRILRRQLGIGTEDCFFVSVGELNENKNHRVVLEALDKLRHLRGSLAGIRYGICGDGFFRDRLQRWIAELNLSGVVTLYGYRTDIPQMLGCADAAVFPSIREGLGMAGLEALAMGIPVIAADNRGTREYMRHGKNGFVCSPHNGEEFARSMERILHLREPEKRKIAADCRASAQPFRQADTICRMREIYRMADQRIGEG